MRNYGRYEKGMREYEKSMRKHVNSLNFFGFRRFQRTAMGICWMKMGEKCAAVGQKQGESESYVNNRTRRHSGNPLSHSLGFARDTPNPLHIHSVCSLSLVAALRS